MPDFADAVSPACLPVQAVVGTWLFGVDHVETQMAMKGNLKASSLATERFDCWRSATL
jgi:hypothetical protein